MQLAEFTNKVDAKTYELFIRGIIGQEVSGAAIAEQIDALEKTGAEKIILRINTPGGSVLDGFNVVEAIQRTKMEVETVNIGIAASMGAIILAVGDVRKCLDFSTALIHDPLLGPEKMNEIQDPQKLENLTRIKLSLQGILKDYTNQAGPTISKIMSRETVFSAQEQKQFGLVDTIIKSKQVKPSFKNMDLTQIMNICDDLNKNKPNINKMKKLTEFLNLQDEAAEGAILESVKGIATSADNYKSQVEELQNETAQLKADLQLANDQLKEVKNQAIKNAVDGAINTGKFTEEKREFLTKQATTNLDLFKNMVEAMPILSGGAIQEIKNQKPQGETVKDWEYYQKNDPNTLKNMEKENPAEYKKLFEAYWGEPYE